MRELWGFLNTLGVADLDLDVARPQTGRPVRVKKMLQEENWKHIARSKVREIKVTEVRFCCRARRWPQSRPNGRVYSSSYYVWNDWSATCNRARRTSERRSLTNTTRKSARSNVCDLLVKSNAKSAMYFVHCLVDLLRWVS